MPDEVTIEVDEETEEVTIDIVIDGDGGDALEEHIADTNNPHAVTKAQVGLGNVDNTSDAGKPVSGATQTALDAKAAKPPTGRGAIASEAVLASDPRISVWNRAGLEISSGAALSARVSGPSNLAFQVVRDLAPGSPPSVAFAGGYLFELHVASDANNTQLTASAFNALRAANVDLNLRFTFVGSILDPYIVLDIEDERPLTGGHLPVPALGPVPGPYEDDEAAAGDDIPLKGLYFTSDGVVHVRLE